MKRTVKCTILLLALVLALTGCTKTDAEIKKKSVENLPSGMVRISPSSLFEGDAKKLEPHLGLISGCVDVAYNGPKKFISAHYEIWENGKMTRSLGALGMPIDQGYKGSVSMSIKNESNSPTKQRNRVVVVMDGSSMTSIDTDLIVPDGGRSYSQLDDPIEVKDEGDIAVWACTAYKEAGHSYYGEIEKSLKEAEWAVVLKVSFNKDHLQ